MTPQKLTSSYLFEKNSLKVQLEIEHITGYYHIRPLNGDMFTFKGHYGDKVDTHRQTTIIDLILTALVFVRKELEEGPEQIEPKSQ